VTTGPLSISNVRFSGFNLASELGALGSFGGAAQSGSDTLIQSMSSKLRVAPEGIRSDNLDIVIPALGTITGSGTITPSNALNFRMVAKLNAGASALTGLKGIPGFGQGANGLAFRIQGTTSNPVFLPDVAGALGGGLPVPAQGGQGLSDLLGGLTGQKKK
jgi:AsmA protein